MMSFFDGIKQDLFKSPNQTWIDPEVSKKREDERRANSDEIAELWKVVDRKILDPFLKRSKNPRDIETDWKKVMKIPADPGWSLPSFDADAVGFKASDKWPRNKPVTLRSEFGLQEIPKQFLIYLKGEIQQLEIFINGAPVHEGVIEKVHGEYFIPLPVTELTTGKNVIGIIAKSNRGEVKVRVTREPVHDLDVNQLASIHPVLVSRAFGDAIGGKMKILQERRRALESPLQGLSLIHI